MNEARRRIADELYAVSHAHDQALSDRLERFRSVEPATAELLGVLVRATGARRILELGTSSGYGAIWLADAAQATGGRLTSVEIDPLRCAIAGANLERAGLHAELRCEDAAATLAGSPDAWWDFLFLDAERTAYAGYWPELRRSLRPRGGLAAIDNVISHPAEVAQVSTLIEAQRSVTSAVVAVGAGLRLVVRDE